MLKYQVCSATLSTVSCSETGLLFSFLLVSKLVILELIYCCCVTCTDVTVSCASPKHGVWAGTGSKHAQEVFTKPWKCQLKIQQSWLGGRTLWHTKGTGRKRHRREFFRAGAAAFKAHRARQEPSSQAARCGSRGGEAASVTSQLWLQPDCTGRLERFLLQFPYGRLEGGDLCQKDRCNSNGS